MPDELYNKMKSILVDVELERHRQFQKWGLQNREQKEWVVIAGEEFGEVSKEIVDNFLWDCTPTIENIIDLRKEWVQLAAVAIQSIEELDRLYINNSLTDCPGEINKNPRWTCDNGLITGTNRICKTCNGNGKLKIQK